MPPNPFVLAADQPAVLLQLLRDADPAAAAEIARSQDEYGYSLVHAAASYSHADLLRALVRDFGAPVDLRDEDGETALFTAESVAVARVLVEELGLDPRIQNAAGDDALDKFDADGEWPAVAEYLRERVGGGREGGGGAAAAADDDNVGSGPGAGDGVNGTTTPLVNGHGPEIPEPPEGMSISAGTMEEEAAAALEAHPEFRRRIEELAARDDFYTAEGQAALRQLVLDAVSGQDGLGETRNVRPRTD